MLTYGQKMELEITERVTAKVKAEVTTQAQRDFLLRQLGQRFGSLPPEVKERVQQADRQALERWVDRILDAKSLDDVFAA